MELESYVQDYFMSYGVIGVRESFETDVDELGGN